MASMSSDPADACTRCARTSANASTPKPMTMEVRIRDCGTGSANDAATAPSSTIGGCPRVTPAAAKMRMFDPFASRLSPMINCARRRRSMRYNPQAYSEPATIARTNSISSLAHRDIPQREDDREHDTNHGEEDPDVEDERRTDRDACGIRPDCRPEGCHERKSEHDGR